MDTIILVCRWSELCVTYLKKKRKRSKDERTFSDNFLTQTFCHSSGDKLIQVVIMSVRRRSSFPSTDSNEWLSFDEDVEFDDLFKTPTSRPLPLLTEVK